MEYVWCWVEVRGWWVTEPRGYGGAAGNSESWTGGAKSA